MIFFIYQVSDKREQLSRAEAQLKGVVRGNIKQLTTYIFPISQVKPTPRLVILLNVRGNVSF